MNTFTDILEAARLRQLDSQSDVVLDADRDASNVEDRAWELFLKMVSTASAQEAPSHIEGMCQMAFRTAHAFQQYADNKAWADLIPPDQLREVMTAVSKLKGN